MPLDESLLLWLCVVFISACIAFYDTVGLSVGQRTVVIVIDYLNLHKSLRINIGGLLY